MNSLLGGSAVGLLLTGAAIAAVLGSIAIRIGHINWPWRTRGIPIGGIVLVMPLLLVQSDGRRMGVLGLAGIVALLVAGFTVPQRIPALVHGAAALPGAALLAFDTTGPAIAIVLILTPAVVTAIATFEEGHDYEHGISLICAAIAGGGAFLSLPDTEHIALVAGAGVAVGLLVLAEPRLTLGASRAVWAGVFVWVVVVDGVGRVTGLIGALGTLGLLLIDPVLRSNLTVNRGLLTYLPSSGIRQQLIVVAAIQTGIALFASRIAGFREEPIQAIVLVLVVWAITGAGLAHRARSMP